eukprot:TRINITY_DN14456_c0_g1_i8.p1 TRINITY_DN14456_c0_g1~~TRINITY_DN14456_c0_g1_i8.p1  ORF type:complete len:800 (-),score=114.80 TRINITY_DN14456_c0_g1_i8:40-2358(-)
MATAIPTISPPSTPAPTTRSPTVASPTTRAPPTALPTSSTTRAPTATSPTTQAPTPTSAVKSSPTVSGSPTSTSANQVSTSFSNVADMQRLKANLQAIYTTASTTVSALNYRAQGFMHSMSSDGSWADIDYASTRAASWDPMNHAKRVYAMAQAFSQVGGTYYQNDNMYAATLTAVRFWYGRMLTNPSNWYSAQIGVNIYFAPTCFLLNEMKKLSASDFSGCSRYMAITDLNNPFGQDYTNLVWIGEIILCNAVFWNNWTLANDFVNRFASQLSYSSGFNPGPKVDGSFLYHGSLLYTGGYGQNFYSAAMSMVTDYLPGTSFQGRILVNQDGLARFVVDSQYFINWPANVHDMLDQGRMISRTGCCTNVISSGTLTKFSKYLGDPWKQNILDFASRVTNSANSPPIFLGNYHFWKADYVAHRRRNYNMFLRMSSKRTKVMECLNSENLRGQHLTDGVLLTYFTGDEWRSVLPAMNWKQWPGTTLEQSSTFECASYNQMGLTSFVGGVSQGSFGVTALDFSSFKGTVQAKKGYFFFPDFVVLLGSGITWASTTSVRTTVEQRPLVGSVYMNSASNVINANPELSTAITSASWIYHNKIGYFFPGNIDQDVSIFAGSQSGSWASLTTTATSSVTANFFNIGIMHKQSSSYEFVIVPDRSLSEFSQSVNALKADIRVIWNTPSVQVVSQVSTLSTECIFWKAEATTILNGFSLSVSRPIVVIVQQLDNSPRFNVSVADPSQTTAASVTMTLNSVTRTITLPTGEYTGSGINFVIG